MTKINLPSLRLRAFNLTEGSAFLEGKLSDPDVWIVVSMTRDPNSEHVHTWVRTGNRSDDPAALQQRAFTWHYCDIVHLVGIVANPADPDDNDWGGDY